MILLRLLKATKREHEARAEPHVPPTNQDTERAGEPYPIQIQNVRHPLESTRSSTDGRGTFAALPRRWDGGEKRDRFTARIHRHDTTSPAYRHPTRRRPAADASTWKAKAKHHRTHGHLIKQLGIDAAGPLRTCWSLGKLSFNFKTIC